MVNIGQHPTDEYVALCWFVGWMYNCFGGNM